MNAREQAQQWLRRHDRNGNVTILEAGTVVQNLLAELDTLGQKYIALADKYNEAADKYVAVRREIAEECAGIADSYQMAHVAAHKIRKRFLEDK